jgi:uncharacterized membrane protein YdcZ (DUF606 family)
MGIDRIPGVGPLNADIATAVAAPSAATIAAAVGAPSAATIAAAVAAPSAATIAAAVAAPSSATIASAVAAAVPTRANIQSDIGTYGLSPNAWTVISTSTGNSTVATYTFSSLSGYKTYKLLFSTKIASSANIAIRINGVTTGTYSYVQSNINPSLTSASQANITATSTSMIIGTSVDTFIHGEMFFPNASLVCNKFLRGDVFYRSSLNDIHGINFLGQNSNTAAITSITFFSNGGNFDSGNITLLGAN